jgi:cell division protein FtsL
MATLIEAEQAYAAIPQPFLRGLETFIPALKIAASMREPIQAAQRMLTDLREQIAKEQTEHTSRTTEALVSHETATAERRVELADLDDKISEKHSVLVGLEGEISEAKALTERAKRIKENVAEHLNRLDRATDQS